MKIVFVLPRIDLTGGVKVALGHASFLRSQGHDVVCVCPAPRRPGWKKRLKSLVFGGPSVEWYMDRAQSGDQSLNVIRGKTQGRLLPQEIPPADVIISTWWETVLWSAALPASAGRQVHFVQDHEVFEFLPLDLVGSAYRAPGYKIVVSVWLRDIMRDTYQSQHLMLVENGVDPERFLPSPATSRTADCGLVWSSTKRKNSAMAVEALQLARVRKPSLSAVVFGAEPCPPNLKGLSWISYHEYPPQEQIPVLYASCRTWLFPSTSEGFGLPMLEALASGTPVVATKAGAAPQLVDASDGIMIECNARAMADGLLKLLDLPLDDWNELSRNARVKAEYYSQKRSHEQFEAALLAIHAGQA